MKKSLALIALCLAILPISFGCGTLPNPLDNNDTENPDRIATIDIFNPDIDDYQTLTLVASGSKECQNAIRQIRAQLYTEAKTTLNAHLAEKESDANAWYALGALHEYDEDYDGALKAYQNAVVNDKKASGEYQSAVERVINLVD